MNDLRGLGNLARLPLELRQSIWSLLPCPRPDEPPHEHSWDRPRQFLAILETSPAIRAEAETPFYQHVRLAFGISQDTYHSYWFEVFINDHIKISFQTVHHALTRGFGGLFRHRLGEIKINIFAANPTPTMEEGVRYVRKPYDQKLAGEYGWESCDEDSVFVPTKSWREVDTEISSGLGSRYEAETERILFSSALKDDERLVSAKHMNGRQLQMRLDNSKSLRRGFGPFENWDMILLNDDLERTSEEGTMTLRRAYDAGLIKDLWSLTDWFDRFRTGMYTQDSYKQQDVPTGYDNHLLQRVCDWVREKTGSLPAEFK